jgi:hypothetical protein
MFTSCNKEEKEEQESEPAITAKNYISIDDAQFRGGDLPDGNTPVISDLSINRNVAIGGSTFVSFTSPERIQTAYISVNDVYGYFAYTFPADYNADLHADDLFYYELILNISQNISEENIVISISCLTQNGITSESENSDEINVIQVGTGKLQINLSWINTVDDVDLHLLEPDENEIYYGSRRSNGFYTNEMGGELDLDSNPSCFIDGINSENITYEKEPALGVYYVAVDLFEKCESSTSAGSQYSVTVNYHGQLITISDKQRGKFEDNDSGSFNNESRFHIIGGFEITASGIKVISVTENPFVSSLRSGKVKPSKKQIQ